jgi:hypothetical protein
MKHIKTFESFIAEAGGRDAGKYEVAKIDLKTAVRLMEEKGYFEWIDQKEFERNFLTLQKWVVTGKTKRKDMPVLSGGDVSLFADKLTDGLIDVHKPYSDFTTKGLIINTTNAEVFMTAGKLDGIEDDDKVSAKFEPIPANKLKPIQEQIYFDECIGFLEHGLNKAIAIVESKNSVVSNDNFIIDGHHRWGFAMLFAPTMKFRCLSIDLEIEKLVKVALEFGDALGNARNK